MKPDEDEEENDDNDLDEEEGDDMAARTHFCHLAPFWLNFSEIQGGLVVYF